MAESSDAAPEAQADSERPRAAGELGDKQVLSAREAAASLGVRRETLYAYVSRGLLRSVDRGGGRSRSYLRSEVEGLKAKRDLRRQPAKAALGALHFGVPVLQSELTLIEQGRFYYRGLEVRELCRTRRLEDIASWLWLGDFDSAAELFSRQPPPSTLLDGVVERFRRPWSLEALQSALPVFGAEDPAAWVTGKKREVAQTSARLLARMARLAAGNQWRGQIASSLLAGWKGQDLEGQELDPASVALIDAALILCADHELNVSAFTARCVASAGSPMASVVGAGLSALQGPEHGGHTRRMEALLREAGHPEELRDVIADRLQRGDPVPGFGQRLYPDGDPRYLELSARLRASCLGPFGRGRLAGDIAAWADAIEDAGRELLGEPPTVDAALVLTARGLGLPRDAALCLFALGRTVGWIGHALEQYAVGRLIRPRAHYVGVRP